LNCFVYEEQKKIAVHFDIETPVTLFWNNFGEAVATELGLEIKYPSIHPEYFSDQIILEVPFRSADNKRSLNVQDTPKITTAVNNCLQEITQRTLNVGIRISPKLEKILFGSREKPLIVDYKNFEEYEGYLKIIIHYN
jgi:hypothetical protein